MITAVITKKGRILQNKQVNGADLVFTRVVAGEAITPIDELKDKMSVTSVQQTLSIQSIKQNEKEQSYTILVLLENANLTKSYNLNQIGFYAKDPNDGEILFAIAQFDTPKKIEIPTVEPGYTLEMPFTFRNSGSANVTIEFDPDNLMSRAGVQAMLDSEEISGIASGNVISIFDGSGNPFLDFNLFGKSEQVTTKGYQLFDASRLASKSGGGATITNNEDGSFTIRGSGALSEGVWTHYTLTDEEYSKIMQVGNILYVNAMPSTNPFVFFGLYDADNTNIASLSNRQGVGEKLTITQDLIEQSVIARFYILGNVSSTIKGGTIKPMYYMEGDGTWEPFSGGKPAPSPDYPQEIESTGEDGSVNLNVQGKNLWAVDNTNENLTYDAATQVMTINGAVAQTVYELPMPIPKGTTVTISAEVVSGVVTSKGDGGLAFGGYYKPEVGTASWQGYINVPACSVQDLTGQKYKQIFETTEEVTHFYAFAYAATASIHEPLKVKVQYEINNYATDFEPHKAIQTANISTPNGLRGIPVPNGGNYTDKNGQEWACDEIDLAKRKYIQRILDLTLTGSEAISRENNTTWAAGCYVVYIGNTNPKHINGEVMCTFLPPHSNVDLAEGKFEYGIGTHGQPNLMIKFGEDVNTLELAKEAWKNAIETGGKVYTILDTPIETDLTDEQIAAFESLTAYEGATTILMGGIGNMEVQYFKDTDNGKAMGILKSEHIYLKKLIGDVNAVVQNLVG